MAAQRNQYKDLLVIVVGFTIIGLIFRIDYMVYAALGLGVACIFSEWLTNLVTKGWQHFGELLGKINSTILLSLLFIFMLAPIALVKKLTERSGKDDASSNWSDSDESTADFEKMW